MTQISELDLQNLRHLIGGYEMTHCKMDAYAQQAIYGDERRNRQSVEMPESGLCMASELPRYTGSQPVGPTCLSPCHILIVQASELKAAGHRTSDDPLNIFT